MGALIATVAVQRRLLRQAEDDDVLTLVIAVLSAVYALPPAAVGMLVPLALLPAFITAFLLRRRRRALQVAVALLVGVAMLAAGKGLSILRRRAHGPLDVRRVPVASNLPRPTDIQFPPGPGAFAVVLGQAGTAWLVDVDSGDVKVWFHAPVYSNLECGLLGLAFEPTFAKSGRFYTTQCTRRDGKTVWQLVEWRASSGLQAPPKPSRTLLEIEQPWDNHKAGQLRFGKDGFLYVGLGDGGSLGDPDDRAQDLSQLFGKLLRIDPRRPEGGREYAIPPDNPFVNVAGARPEVWAYGLRNPWRFDFLPDGRLIVGDVGELSWEEINIVAAGDNLGWNVREGRHCYKPRVDCPSAGFVEPFYEYPHNLGVSVTGGVMVWDRSLPALYGKFVFADFGVGTIDALSMKGEVTHTRLRGGAPTAFGRDHDKRVYVTDFPAGRLERLASWD